MGKVSINITNHERTYINRQGEVIKKVIITGNDRETIAETYGPGGELKARTGGHAEETAA